MALVFPPVGITEKEDAKLYGVELQDSTITSDTEGGYEYTRPRFTRAPSRTFKSGFTSLDGAQYEAFEAFWQVNQSHTAFDWTNPATGELIRGRMREPTVKYEGIGLSRLYTVTYSIKEI